MPKKSSRINIQTRRNFIIHYLRHAPSEGFGVTEIHEAFVKKYDDKIDRKTIERDLDDHLCLNHGVYIVDEKSPTKKYTISSDYAENMEVTINEENLQVINLALGLLSKLGPRELSSMVADVENALLETLPDELKEDFENFKELQSISPSNAGKAIVKNGQILKPILTALRKGRTIECEYFSKGRGAIETREIAPVFIELFGGEPYLLAEDPTEDYKIKRFKLTRMDKVKILDHKCTGPEKENCTALLNSYAGVGGEGTQIFDVVVNGNEQLLEHFEGIELHPTQKVTKHADGSCTIEFKMPESYPFYRYLAGLGKWITRIEPIDVMRQVRAIWKDGAKNMGLIVEWPERDTE